MLTKIVSFDKLDGYRLRVRFNDGSTGVHDFTSVVAEPGAMLVPLRNPAYFGRVFLEFGALTWPNGFDVAPNGCGARWLKLPNLHLRRRRPTV